jgi:alpha-glucosidase (family GH31 glycosyl hydrolase)
VWDEYCYGQSFLVSPIVEPGQKVKRVYLPSGIWYDWYAPTNSFTGGRWVSVAVSPSHLPVFVRQNALFVTGKNWLDGNSVQWNGTSDPELIVEAFPGKKNFTNGFVYLDHYNNDSLVTISIVQNGKALTIHLLPMGCSSTLLIHNVAANASDTLDGRSIVPVVNADAMTVEIPLLKRQAHVVQIEQ